jgi:hypothetical protein
LSSPSLFVLVWRAFYRNGEISERFTAAPIVRSRYADMAATASVINVAIVMMPCFFWQGPFHFTLGEPASRESCPIFRRPDAIRS